MQPICGTTRLAGVIGHPLAHSLSPAMHNAVYEELGLDWVYVPLHVSDEIGLRRVVAAIQSLPFMGFNVTMPFKQAVLELCDEVAMAASMAGAVNTVHCVDGRLVGYNTDGRGLLEALKDEAGFEPAGKDVVICGAGGAAGAALVGLMLAQAASITIVNRNIDGAEELLDRVRPHMNAVRVQAVSAMAAEENVRAADLVVNATPVGMRPEDDSPIPVQWVGPGQVVYDMIYGRSTALVRGARAQGALAFDGLGMLVAQGATAVDIWNESKQVRASRATMRAAAEAQLAAHAQGGR